MRQLLLAAAAFVAGIGSGEAAMLVVRATGIGSADGMVYVGVCATGFDEAQCPYKSRARARPGTVELRIPDVKPGRYAIAIYHDVNGNGQLDKTFFRPSEPYGFSNGAGRSTAPRFGQAAVQVTSGAAISIRLTSIAARR